MVVPYLFGKLSQPVRLQQQRGGEGGRMETKSSMRYVGGVMIKSREEEQGKKNVKMGNSKRTSSRN